MQILTQWLLERDIQVLANDLRDDGSRRLKLELAGGNSMDLVLPKELLRGRRAEALAFIEAMISSKADKGRIKHGSISLD